MITIDTQFIQNKSGTYVEFKMKVETFELTELNAYDKYMRKAIKQDFEELFTKHQMDFTTEGAYVVTKNDALYLIVCLNGETTNALENCLLAYGIHRG